MKCTKTWTSIDFDSQVIGSRILEMFVAPDSVSVKDLTLYSHCEVPMTGTGRMKRNNAK